MATPSESQSSTISIATTGQPPRGIRALAVVYPLGVVLAGVALCVSESKEVGGLQFFFLLVVGVFAILTSVGLWKGLQWAWWLALFYHFWFGICIRLESILGLHNAGDEIARVPNLSRAIPMVLLHIGIVLYLLSPMARRHLKAQGVATWKPVLLSIIGGFLLTILTAVAIAVFG